MQLSLLRLLSWQHLRHLLQLSLLRLFFWQLWTFSCPRMGSLFR